MTLTKKSLSLLVPSIADILFATLLLYLSFSAGKGLLADCDTGYHIVTGKYIIDSLSIPRHDLFSFLSPPIPWTAHEWLSEVIMALLHQAFGLTGVVIFFSFLISSTFYLFFRTIRTLRGNILLAVTILLLVIAAAKIHWLARPHIFSMLLMVVWYAVLDSYQYRSRNYLYLFPPLMLLWVNLHGGFIAGFILLGGYLIGNLLQAFTAPTESKQAIFRRVTTLSAITGLCLLACLANPFGYEILLFPFNLVSNQYIMDHVSEFLSPNFHEPLMFKYLLLLLLALFAASRKKLNVIEIGLILLFTNMALYSARYIPLFAIIAAPITIRQSDLLLIEARGRIAGYLKKRAESISAIDTETRGFLWIIAAVVVVVVCAATGKIDFRFDPKTKPVAAVEFLKKEHIKGNVFNDDEFGDYVIYAAAPDYKVFFDGRSDMYGADRLKEYFKIINIEPGWEKTLEKYKIDWIFYNADSVLSRHLLENNRWRLIYADKVANIFVRNIPAYSYLITRYRDIKPVPIISKDTTT